MNTFSLKALMRKRGYRKFNLSRTIVQSERLCHAPFKSLLFTQSGAIMVCHFNRGYVLGNYPANSINEILESASLQKLQKQHNFYNFPESCQYCKIEIENQRYYNAGCKKYDYLAEYGKPEEIVSLEFQTSNACNLECIMCSGEYSSLIRKNRECGVEYPDPYDDVFIEQIKPLLRSVKFASFTGGEPFLNPLYYKIWKLIVEINPQIKITISTNGTLLNDKIKELFNALTIDLTLSIDSLDKKTYGQIRKNADFDKTFENIQYFIEVSKAKQRLFSIKFVIMKGNIQDVPELFEYFNEQNVQIYPKLVWVPVDLSLRYGTSEELKEWIYILKRCHLNRKLEYQKFNCERYSEIISTLEKWEEELALFTKEKLILLTTEDLTGKLHELLCNFVNNDSMIEYDKRIKLLNFAEELLHFITRSNIPEKEMQNFLAYLLSLPRYLLVNEFYRMNAEKFVNRLKVKKSFNKNRTC